MVIFAIFSHSTDRFTKLNWELATQFVVLDQRKCRVSSTAVSK